MKLLCLKVRIPGSWFQIFLFYLIFLLSEQKWVYPTNDVRKLLFIIDSFQGINDKLFATIELFW